MEQMERVLKVECDWFIIQEEKGAEGTAHLQGTLKLKRRKRLSELKKLNTKIHWEATKCVTSSLAYCTKEATRNGCQWVHGIQVPEPLILQEPYGWQLPILSIIQQQPSPRTIHWYWDPNGGVGKTTLCKYLVVKYQAIYVSGKSSDIFHSISKAPSKKLVLFDFPRSQQDFINYAAIEKVKDGLIFSGKYDSTQLVFNTPHVIVFANLPPDYSKLSSDRWCVTQLII